MNNGQQENMFLHGSLPLLFLKTATPIILVMSINGLFALVDAWFLGTFVNADALSAVTMMFSLYMVMVACSTLVSNGYASVAARLLGAREIGQAHNALMGAQLLAMIVCAALVGTFLAIGHDLVDWFTNGSRLHSDYGYSYISLMVYGTPLMFLLSINADGMRCEGRLVFMSVVSLTSALLNIPFNYLLIVTLDLGVPGSAYGTILSQACVLAMVAYYRMSGRAIIGFAFRGHGPLWRFWGQFLPLGLPFSLTYIGVSLIAFMILFDLKAWSADSYTVTAGAYGIITRLMTFMYLPLLGLSFGFQTILGNNYGAQNYRRATKSFRLAIGIAFVYCLGMEILFQTLPGPIGAIFVDDPAIVAEIARILPVMTMLMILFGPQLMATTYFQAVGDAPRALVLSVTRTYLLALPLIFSLPYWLGEWGIWIANPVTEALMTVLTVTVFLQYRRKHTDLMLRTAD